MIPNIFPNSGAQTLQTEFGKSYVISNLKARRVPSWYAQQLGHVSFAEKEVVQPQIENAPAEGSQELELRAAFTGQNHAVERPDEEIIRESSSEAEPRALQEEANRSQEQRPMSPNGLHSEEPLAALSPPNESVEDSHQHQLDTESQEIASQLTAPQVDSAAPEETRAATPPREPDGGVQNASIQQLSPELPEAQEGDSALHTSKSVPSARSSRSSSPTSSEGGGRSHSGHSSEFDAYGENADIENSGNAGTDGRYVSIENHDFASSPQLGHASTLQSDSTDKHEERHHIEHVGQSSEGHIMQTEEDGLEDHHSLFYT